MKILVSGLVNTETTVKIRKFPIEYYPIDYPFFGIDTRVSGVAYNIVKALRALNDNVGLVSMTAKDIAGEAIKSELRQLDVSLRFLDESLTITPSSVVLYDDGGKRQIYCDLKDIQERRVAASEEMFRDCDLFAACNINFSRSLLKEAKCRNIMIATDVHVLGDIDDDYNREFMQYADILFLSDEALPCAPTEFLNRISQKFHNRIIVLGQGANGAMMYERDSDCLYQFSAVRNNRIVNTVGAGDALFSSFLHFYRRGLSAVESLKRAEIFASVKIGYNGAAEGFADENVIEKKYKQTEFSITALKSD